VKPAAAAAVAGLLSFRGNGLAMVAALLLSRGKGPSLGGVLRVLRKVGVGRVALVKLRVVFIINGKTAASCPEYPVEPL